MLEIIISAFKKFSGDLRHKMHNSYSENAKQYKTLRKKKKLVQIIRVKEQRLEEGRD